MRKAMTPVVAIILLILMTVGSSALAFFWVNNVQGSLQESVGSSIEGDVPSDCSRMSLISVRGDEATVQNVGCDTVDSVNVIIDGVLTSYDLDTPLAPGQAGIITFTSNLAEGQDHTIDIVTSNGETSTLQITECTLEQGCEYECTIPAECDDSNVCTDNTCVGGTCSYPALSDGQRIGCDSGTNACISGVCTDTCGDATCQSWENTGNCLADCSCQETQGSCNSPNVWFEGSISSSSLSVCACCGDDATSDDFYNGTLATTEFFCNDATYVNQPIDYNKTICESYSYDWFETNGTFSAGDEYTTGSGTYGPIIADLNGDGWNDIVNLASSDTDMNVFINQGDGTYGSRATYNAASTPANIAVGDVDNDGDNDIIFTNYLSVNIWVYFNNGVGGFVFSSDYSTGNRPWDIDLGDLDNDGWLDVVVSNRDNAQITVMINDGDGTFDDSLVTYGASAGTEAVDIGDVDNDGWLDIVAVERSNAQADVYINDGDGTFGAAVTYTTGTSPEDVALGDLDNDGWLDFVTADSDSNQVGVFINDGDGTFAARVAYTAGTDLEGVEVGDFNNDGWLDLVTADEGDDTASVLLNNKDGTFAARSTYATNVNPAGVDVGDVNKDGIPDFVIADYLGADITVYTNLGVSGSNGACCGDDTSADDFTNMTHQCIDGSFSEI